MEKANQLHQQLQHIIAILPGHWPEFTIALGLVAVLVLDLIFYKKEGSGNWWLGWVNLLFLLLAFSLTWQLRTTLFGFMQMVLLLAGVLFVLLSLGRKQTQKKAGEYYSVFNGLLVGALLLVKATSLIQVYLGIEMLSISAYILTGFSFHKKSAEASLKYLLFGAVSSAVMLFGMSLLYGFTATLNVTEMNLLEVVANVGALPVKLGFFMVLFGLLFKVAAVPMHIWSPDVYEAAPLPVVALFSVVPKLAAFSWVLLVNNQWLVFSEARVLLIVVAFLSITVGNFAALWQKNARRMLAYSSIAHTGFLMMALFANSQSLIFYGVVYLMMNFTAFGLVQLLESKLGSSHIPDFAGVGKKLPMVGVMLTVVMFALTGLPPTAGFMAKFFVFTGVWQNYVETGSQSLLWLFVFGLLNTVVALFYYLRIPYYMFLKKGNDDLGINTSPSILNYLMVVLFLSLLFWFFAPNSLMDMVYNINFAP